MTIIKATSKENFEEIVRTCEQKYVFVDFFATWCGPCKRILPVLEQLSEDYKDSVCFVKVDVDEIEELATLYQIRGMPTFIVLDKENLANLRPPIVGANESLIRSTLESLANGVSISEDF